MVDKYEEKYVKIIPKLKLDFKNGYQIVGKPLLEPDSIKIGGAPALLNTIKFLTTQEVYINNVNANIVKLVNVTDSLSNIIWKSEVQTKLTVNVELSAEKDFQGVRIQITDIPQDKEVLLIPQNISLQLKGGVNQLSGIDASRISETLNYNKIFADTTVPYAGI